MRLGVVGAVGQECSWSSPRPAAFALQGWDGLDERQQLGDVVAIGAGEDAGERDAIGVGDQVVFAAGSSPINGIGSGLAAPKSARREAESQTARERSSWSFWRSLARSSWWRRAKTPA